MRPLLKSTSASKIVLGVSVVAIVWICFQPGTHRHTGILRTLAAAKQFLRTTSNSAVLKQTKGDPSAGPHHSVNLSWKASHSAVVGYNVYRRGIAGSSKINSALVFGTNYVDSSVQPGQTYYYVTRAVSSAGTESSPSNEVKVVIPSR